MILGQHSSHYKIGSIYVYMKFQIPPWSNQDWGIHVGMSLFFNWQGQPFKADFEGLFKLEIISILLYVDDMAIMVDDEGELEHCIQVLEAITQRWGVDNQCKENKTLEGKLEGGRWGGTTWKHQDAHPHYYSGGGNWGNLGF